MFAIPIAILDKENQVVNGKKALIRNALHQCLISWPASEVVFMQSCGLLAKTTGETEL